MCVRHTYIDSCNLLAYNYSHERTKKTIQRSVSIAFFTRYCRPKNSIPMSDSNNLAEIKIRKYFFCTYNVILHNIVESYLSVTKFNAWKTISSFLFSS